VVLRGTINLLRCFNLSARVGKLIHLPAFPLDVKYKNSNLKLNIKLPPSTSECSALYYYGTNRMEHG
jgi:hypothetical protein